MNIPQTLEIYRELPVPGIVLGIVVASLFFILLVRYIHLRILRSTFQKTYRIRLRRQIKVRRKKRGNNSKNGYTLKFPSWEFPNRDGTQDKRRSKNDIVWGISFLFIDDYRLSCARPPVMILTVNELRNNSFKISMNKVEIEKCKRIRQQKIMFQARNSIKEIVHAFASQPTDFEKYCAHIFRFAGFKARVTSRTSDGGFDIILHSETEGSAIVECKCYDLKNLVGRPEIQKLVGANAIQKASRMIFITTSDFSKGAISYASDAEVELINGNKLLAMVNQYLPTQSATISTTRKEWSLQNRDLAAYYPRDIPV